MEAIICLVIMLAIAYFGYRVSKNKGYNGILFGIGTLIFPLLLIVVLILPDKEKSSKRNKSAKVYAESLYEQQAKEKSEVKASSTKTESNRTMPVAGTKSPYKEVTADTVVNHEYALKFYNDGIYTEALRLFISVAETGHVESQMYCAQMYYQGQGCTADKEKALYWYERAAEQGQTLAQNNCSYLYESGIGCTVDLKKALFWKEKAAQHGNPDDQFKAGMMYELGQGCSVDLNKAAYWYSKAASQGHADAKRLLDGMKDSYDI